VSVDGAPLPKTVLWKVKASTVGAKRMVSGNIFILQAKSHRLVSRNDEPVGLWTYYFENGKVSSQGEFVKEVRAATGVRFIEWLVAVKYLRQGTGDYREYYEAANSASKDKW